MTGLEGIEPKCFKSKLLKQRRTVLGWRPRGADPATKLPILYMLHGYTGCEWDWPVLAGAHQTVQRLIDQGVIPPTMLAFVNDGLCADGTLYVNWSDGLRFEDSFMLELVPFVEQTWATTRMRRERWVIGLSMGGFGATNFAWNYPETFGACGALSALFDPAHLVEDIRKSGFQVFADDKAMSGRTPLHKVRRLSPSAREIPFVVICGSEDHLIDQNRLMKVALEDSAHPKSVYEEYPGEHNWAFWTEHLETAIRRIVKLI